MPIDPTLNFPGLFAANPALAQMVDKSAARLDTKSGGGPTATATPPAAGGATADAAANLGGGDDIVTLARRAFGMDKPTNQGQDGLARAPGGAIGSFTTGLVEGLATGLSNAFAPSAPSPTDCFPPCPPGVQPSMLSADSSGKVTTAGGYTIEATSQFEWKICGPDGSSTRVWGDPHVETHGKTGGEKFDFKKDTTFVLPDGTKINVKCTPWSGNKDVTVTQSLEIIQGNDRIQINDIDKGKGKAGQVVHGGEGSKETFKTDQTLVAGSNVADWYFQGAEVKSNRDGTPDKFNVGESILGTVHMAGALGDWSKSPISEAAFTVGGLDSAGNGWGMNTSPTSANLTSILERHGQLAQKGGVNEALQQVLAFLPKLIGLMSQLVQMGSFNPYTPAPAERKPEPAKPTETPKPPTYDPAAHARGLTDAFKALGAMFIALGKMMELMATFKPGMQQVQGR